MNLAYEPQGFHIEWNKPENMSREFLPEGSQAAYDEKIRGCDYFFLLVGRSVGEYTLQEFDLAQEQRKQERSPKIYAFFLLKGGEFPTDKVMNLQKRLRELKYYVTAYSNIDQVKLGIHLEMVRGGAFAGSVVEMKPEKVNLYVPYEGKMPYIFVSYPRRDSERVLPVLEAMMEQGYRVWYDAGISAGDNWENSIAEHLDKSAVFMTFISSSALKSKYVLQELRQADHARKPIVPIILESVEMPPEWHFLIGTIQGIRLSNYDDLGAFIAQINRARVFAACRR